MSPRQTTAGTADSGAGPGESPGAGSAVGSAVRSTAGPIGILGGTFDPVHAGHLQLARTALKHLQLDEVRFVPAAQPWQKGPLTDASARAHMVELAIAGTPQFVLDMREIERGGPSYTVTTLRELRHALGADVPLVWIIGADQMQRLDTWHDWESIPGLAHLAVAPRHEVRPGVQPGAVPALGGKLQKFFDRHRAEPAAVQQSPGGAIVLLPMAPFDVSSSEIRSLLGRLHARPAAAATARLAQILPAAVLDYIRAHHLYRPTMELQTLQRIAIDALEDIKAQSINVFDTAGQSSEFDRVIVATGNSNRQTRALAWHLVQKVKESGGRVISVEGADAGEWVLVDLGDIVVHIMQPAIRQYYALEELWGAKPVRPAAAEAHTDKARTAKARTAKAPVQDTAKKPARESAPPRARKPAALKKADDKPPKKAQPRSKAGDGKARAAAGKAAVPKARAAATKAAAATTKSATARKAAGTAGKPPVKKTAAAATAARAARAAAKPRAKA